MLQIDADGQWTGFAYCGVSPTAAAMIHFGSAVQLGLRAYNSDQQMHWLGR
jgi:hypothetical protein